MWITAASCQTLNPSNKTNSSERGELVKRDGNGGGAGGRRRSAKLSDQPSFQAPERFPSLCFGQRVLAERRIRAIVR